MTLEIRHQVFVSSTATDLQEERIRLWQTLVSLDYIVSGMEAFPATDDEQFKYIEQQISQSDYYVLIIAGRYGSTLDDGTSYTEREFSFAQEKKIPTLVFLHRDIGSVKSSQTDQDSTKFERLKSFRNKVSRGRLCSFWSTPDDLALNVLKSLQTATKATPRPGWQRGAITDPTELLNDIRTLQIENNRLKGEALSLSGKTSPQLKEELKKASTFSYSKKELVQQEGSNKITETYTNTQLTPRAILTEMSLFESANFELFEECLRGAVARKTGAEYEAIAVDRGEVDRAILVFAKLGIVGLARSGSELAIEPGENWLAAHSDTKLNR